MMKHTSELKCSFVGIVLKKMEIGFLKCDFNYIFIVLLNPNLIYSSRFFSVKISHSTLGPRRRNLTSKNGNDDLECDCQIPATNKSAILFQKVRRQITFINQIWIQQNYKIVVEITFQKTNLHPFQNYLNKRAFKFRYLFHHPKN